MPTWEQETMVYSLDPSLTWTFQEKTEASSCSWRLALRAEKRGQGRVGFEF
jgi:hypothetical protein